jgi:hypothetical protein
MRVKKVEGAMMIRFPRKKKANGVKKAPWKSIGNRGPIMKEVLKVLKIKVD